jgi:MinD-like ATPase involved in chromosome partitioning or flagellar assembly
MFISTFYSFKGGVGRTLAMVNVAVDLAKRGRKVLLVDFDLEAPGIDTFPGFENSGNTPGLVEFVSNYSSHKIPPNATDYIYETSLNKSLGAETKGSIWVMPAGRRGPHYEQLLSEIHWRKLYDEMEGFLLFEDLKNQWATAIRPDYVLIDSRTGHTDVGGICTRQLADLVVMLFAPNDQNLTGLPPIAKAIRQENRDYPDRKIETCFVASNVPTLDDEEGILRRILFNFSLALGEKGNRARVLQIHRYDSLQLLNQDIFTLKRPKSRLAKQYKAIADLMVESNTDDRDGVLEYLKRRRSRPYSFGIERTFESSEQGDKRITELLAKYSDDAEILLWICRCDARPSTELVTLLKKAESIVSSKDGNLYREIQLERAKVLIFSGDTQHARDRLNQLALYDGLNKDETKRLFELWREAGAPPSVQLMNCLNQSGMDDGELSGLLERFADDKDWQPFIVDFVLQKISSSPDSRPRLLGVLSIPLLGSGNISKAPDVPQQLMESDGANIANRFNFAMAEWALTGTPKKESFARVVESLNAENERSDTNFYQCMAVAYAVLGERDKALHYLGAAKRTIENLPISTFSCWRYHEISDTLFLRDLEDIRSFIDSGRPIPLFITGFSAT